MRFQKLIGETKRRLKWESKRNQIMARLMDGDKSITIGVAFQQADAEMKSRGYGYQGKFLSRFPKKKKKKKK